MYKYRLVFLGAILCSIWCCSGYQSSKMARTDHPATFVDQHGYLNVVAGQLLDQNNEPIVLRGLSLGWHNWWHRFYNEETIGWLHTDWNCHVIRVPIGVEPEGAYLNRPDFALEKLYLVVDAAIARGMYVIVDWHSHGIHTQEAVDFFTTVATKYADYPNMIYEIYNEPVNSSWEEIKQYAEKVIAAIRMVDKRNVILVGTPNWGQDIHLAADDPIEGYDNIMYTMHFYAATHKKLLRDRTDYALRKGLPVFVSECASMEASGDGSIDYDEWTVWMDWMEQNNLSWVVWSISDKNETCSMIKDQSSPSSGWTNDDLKEWGKYVRTLFRNFK